MHGLPPLFLFAAVSLAAAASVVAGLAPPPDGEGEARTAALSPPD